jgi:two-component system sensor histidine kinase BaeS
VRRRRPLGVRVHVIGAAVALALTSVAVTGLLVHRAVDREVAAFGQENLRQAARQTAGAAAAVHHETHGLPAYWVAQVVRDAALDDRVTVLRGPDDQALPGSPRQAAPNSVSVPIRDDGRLVGSVATGYSRGGAVGFGGRLDELTEEGVLKAAAVAGVLALLLSLIVALRMTRPLQRLTDVARRMAHGEIETSAAHAGGPRETAELASTLDRLAATLRRQDELRRTLVHDVVHELRNALVGVVGRLEALQDGMVIDEKTTLERTARDARRLNRLVDDVLLLAEAQKPSLLVRKCPVELHEICAERAAAHADRFARRQIAFETHATPARVDGDPERLTQIVENLLSNALRYTDPGGRVELRLVVREGEAVLQVADTGIGIAPEHLARIFDRFWRDPVARGRAAEGSGVGLALVRDLVLAHDGRVEAESRLGQGSTFSVFLPLTAELEPELLVREPAPWTASGGTPVPAVWRLRGEIDAANSQRIEAELVDAVARGTGDVVVDLTDVSFIDSSGLGSLVAVAAEVRAHGGHFAVVAGPPHVMRVFDLLQADELMELVESRPAALATLTN